MILSACVCETCGPWKVSSSNGSLKACQRRTSVELGPHLPDLELQSCLLEQLGELVVDRLLDVDSGSGAACLTVVEAVAMSASSRDRQAYLQYTLSGVLDGLLEIGILEDDVRALATKLKGDLLQVGLGGLLHDESTDVGGTSEGDLVDVWVGGKGVSDSWTVTGIQVSGCYTNGSFKTHPQTTFTTPAGRPASLKSLVMYMALSGVSSDGLMTTVHPVARAGAIFQENM